MCVGTAWDTCLIMQNLTPTDITVANGAKIDKNYFSVAYHQRLHDVIGSMYVL